MQRSNSSGLNRRHRRGSIIAEEVLSAPAPFNNRILVDEDELVIHKDDSSEGEKKPPASPSSVTSENFIDDYGVGKALLANLSRRASHLFADAVKYTGSNTLEHLRHRKTNPNGNTQKTQRHQTQDDMQSLGVPMTANTAGPGRRRSNSTPQHRPRSRSRPLNRLPAFNVEPSRNDILLQLHRSNSIENSSPPFKRQSNSNSVPFLKSSLQVAGLSGASAILTKDLSRQLLKAHSVADSEMWFDILQPVIYQAAISITPDNQIGGDMDIRQYLKIKKIPSQTAEAYFVDGFVFSKNVSLKTMPRTVVNPRILLLNFPIEYHQGEQTLLSLDPVIAQGKEYLLNIVNRILVLKPTVLIASSTVSGIALELFAQADLATMQNVKITALEAISRCTGADIVHSSNRLALNPTLGNCDLFTIKASTYSRSGPSGASQIKKTLAYVSGCHLNLGGTILLRGPEIELLPVIKTITLFMAYCVYSLRLETSFFRDEFALMPITPNETPMERNTNPLADVIDSAQAISPEKLEDPKGVEQVYANTILSVSPTTKFPAPYLLEKWSEVVKELDRLQIEFKIFEDAEEGEKLNTRKSVLTKDFFILTAVRYFQNKD